MELKYIANLGDKSPIDYGGFFVYIHPQTNDVEAIAFDTVEDSGGKYAYSHFLCEKLLKTPDDEDPGKVWLSCNKYHPKHEEWWVSKLVDVSETCDVPVQDLIDQLASDDPRERGLGYQTLYSYFGGNELSAGYEELISRRELIGRLDGCGLLKQAKDCGDIYE